MNKQFLIVPVMLVAFSSSLTISAPLNVVTLKLRDHTIQIKSGGQESTYNIEDKAGKLIAKDVTEDELSRSHPEVYESVKTALAFPHEVIDASVQKKEQSRLPLDPARAN